MSTQTLESSSQQVQKPDARPGEWQYYAAKGVDRMQHVVHDNAGSSMLIALASGLGVWHFNRNSYRRLSTIGRLVEPRDCREYGKPFFSKICADGSRCIE